MSAHRIDRIESHGIEHIPSRHLSAIVIAENLSKEHKYIDSITLNGEPYTKNYISHEDIVKGGTLVYKMK